MKEIMNKCKEPAVSDFPWAGKIIKCCEQHTRNMQALNHAIGGVQTPRQIEGKHKCEMPDDLTN